MQSLEHLSVLTLLGALWAAGYVIACAVFPYAACRNCHGTGKFRSPSGRAWRNCRRCKGTGRRIRYGRRIYQKLRRVL